MIYVIHVLKARKHISSFSMETHDQIVKKPLKMNSMAENTIYGAEELNSERFRYGFSEKLTIFTIYVLCVLKV